MEAGGSHGARGEFTDAAKAALYAQSYGAPLVIKRRPGGARGYVCGTVAAAEARFASRCWIAPSARLATGFWSRNSSMAGGFDHGIRDGEHVVMMASAQDHKRVFDNDQGPNTGGMVRIRLAAVGGTLAIHPEEVFQRTAGGVKRRRNRVQGDALVPA